MKQQLLIFDLDGTLADTGADLAAGINRMRVHYGLPPLEQDTVAGFIGDGIRLLVTRALTGAEEQIDIEEALAVSRGTYRECMLNETVLYPGVEDGLNRLSKAGHILAVLSNKPGDFSRILLEHLHVDRFFVRIFGGGDLPNLKPAPDGIIALTGETGIAPENTWMIGDHHTDLAAAHNAGVKSGFVTYGIGSSDSFTPDRIWRGFQELADSFTDIKPEE